MNNPFAVKKNEGVPTKILMSQHQLILEPLVSNWYHP